MAYAAAECRQQRWQAGFDARPNGKKARGITVAALDRIRVLNKRVLNPLMLRMAGRKHWYASVVEHTGRRSGRSYATPVAAEQVPDGFIIPLPYGVGVDWLRNVLAAGHATIRSHGQIYRVAQPQVISAATAAPQLRPERRRTYDLFGVQSYLSLKFLSTQPSAGSRRRDAGRVLAVTSGEFPALRSTGAEVSVVESTRLQARYRRGSKPEAMRSFHR